MISDSENDVFISVVSVWEIQIKIALNKFELKGMLEHAVEVEQTANGFQMLPLSLSHIYNLEQLPSVHKDPFDRMLISQAMSEHLTIVTSDRQFSDYNVKILW